MIGTEDMLVAAVAASLRRTSRARRASRSRDRDNAIARALIAWPRIRRELFAGVRRADAA